MNDKRDQIRLDSRKSKETEEADGREIVLLHYKGYMMLSVQLLQPSTSGRSGPQHQQQRRIILQKNNLLLHVYMGSWIPALMVRSID